MKSEETMVLNSEQNNSKKGAEGKENMSNNAKRVAAAVAGVAAGAGAAAAGVKLFNGKPEEPAANELQHPEGQQEQANEHVEVHEHHHHHHHHDAPIEHTGQTTLVGNVGGGTTTIHTPNNPGTGGGGESSDVHVTDVDLIQHADGSVMTVVDVETDGDEALLLDVESDGTIDYFVHDDNSNGQIEDNEIRDVRDHGWHTDSFVAAYVEEHPEVINEGLDVYVENDDKSLDTDVADVKEADVEVAVVEDAVVEDAIVEEAPMAADMDIAVETPEMPVVEDNDAYMASMDVESADTSMDMDASMDIADM